MGPPFDFCRGSSQVVVVESSATVPSLLASSAAPLDFSSTSGVLGGAAFGAEPPMISMCSGLGLESRPGSGVPLVIGSGVVGLGGSGVGAGFRSAGLRRALGSGLGAGLSLISDGLDTSNFASTG